MNNPVITFERLQTLARLPFDIESVSVTVGHTIDTDQFRVVIRDEHSKRHQQLFFNKTATEDQVNRLLLGAAQDLGLVAGPDKDL